jgi:hypothetical protein
MGRNILIGVAVILVIIAALLPIGIGVFGTLDWVARMQAISVAYVSAFACVGAILFVVVAALLALLVFQIQNHIVPLLEKATDTMETVKGTTTFVSESVVTPIIKVAGAAAGARAMVQTIMRRNGDTSNGAGRNGKKAG